MANTEDFLEHHGIKGQRWGFRRFQNKDGSRTTLGKKHERELAGIEVSSGFSPFRKDESVRYVSKPLTNKVDRYVGKLPNQNESVRFVSKPLTNKVDRHVGTLQNKRHDAKDMPARSGRTDAKDAPARNAKIKRGAAIAAGVLATAAVGYALYKTGAGEKAVNHGKKVLTNILNSDAAKKTSASDMGFSINPKTGKKVATPKVSANNVTESGASLNIPIKKSSSSVSKVSVPKTNAPKATTAPKVSAPKPSGNNLTESGASLNIPIRRSAAANKVVNSAASTPMSATKVTPARRKVAMRVVMDSSDRTANVNSTYDSLNSNLIGFTNSMINQSRR